MVKIYSFNHNQEIILWQNQSLMIFVIFWRPDIGFSFSAPIEFLKKAHSFPSYLI